MVEELHRGAYPSTLGLRAMYSQYVQKMKFATIGDDYGSYKVGEGRIQLRHIHIAALEQVSRSSWQPSLIYSG